MDINAWARRFWSEQASYWRRQGDIAYAEYCETMIASWQP
jgi:hypothetical protein